MKDAILFHNIISPYKTLLFNELNDFLEGSFKVFYFTETSVYRDWRVKKEDIEFSYEILKPEHTLENIATWRLCVQVLKALHRESTDTVIVDEYSSLPYWVILFYCLLLKKRLVCFVESQEQDKQRVRWKEYLKTFFLKKCFKVLAAGTRHRDYVHKLGVAEENIAIVGGVGGVDHHIYDRLKYLYANDKDTLFELLNLPALKYFIYVGRFSKEKNILGFLQAYGELQAWKSGWGVLLLGAGPQEKEIRFYIETNELPNIILPGFVQQDRLPLYYLASEVFVLPSLSETWGLVVDEAIALALPVLISSQCGCVPDIVHDGENGFVFDLDANMADFKVQMGKFIACEEILPVMRKASAEISKEYSTHESARRIIESIFPEKLR